MVLGHSQGQSELRRSEAVTQRDELNPNAERYAGKSRDNLSRLISGVS